MKKIVYIFVIFLFLSCKNSGNDILRTVSYWQNREIIFPEDTSFISYSRKWGERTMHLQRGKYTVLCYVDSMGCMSCKLQLPEWREFIYVVDSISKGTVSFVFVFQSKAGNDLIHFLKRTEFDYPLFIDVNNSFDQLNKFPSDIQLQTFLLDSNNRVVAIGNPIYNPKIKELYLNIIQGKKVIKSGNKVIQTEVNVDRNSIFLDSFDWEIKQKVVFQLKNIGNTPLVINDVITSCGCTSVEYTKEPVRPGKSVVLNIIYKAEHPEHFDKTITVYCNASSSPIRLKISGNAQ